jgi:hypothetical protein
MQAARIHLHIQRLWTTPACRPTEHGDAERSGRIQLAAIERAFGA